MPHGFYTGLLVVTAVTAVWSDDTSHPPPLLATDTFLVEADYYYGPPQDVTVYHPVDLDQSSGVVLVFLPGDNGEDGEIDDETSPPNTHQRSKRSAPTEDTQIEDDSNSSKTSNSSRSSSSSNNKSDSNNTEKSNTLNSTNSNNSNNHQNDLATNNQNADMISRKSSALFASLRTHMPEVDASNYSELWDGGGVSAPSPGINTRKGESGSGVGDKVDLKSGSDPSVSGDEIGDVGKGVSTDKVVVGDPPITDGISQDKMPAGDGPIRERMSNAVKETVGSVRGDVDSNALSAMPANTGGKIRIPVITDEVEDGPEDTMPPGVDSLLARLAAHGYIVVCVTDVDGEFAIDTLQETAAWVSDSLEDYLEYTPWEAPRAALCVGAACYHMMELYEEDEDFAQVFVLLEPPADVLQTSVPDEEPDIPALILHSDWDAAHAVYDTWECPRYFIQYRDVTNCSTQTGNLNSTHLGTTTRADNSMFSTTGMYDFTESTTTAVRNPQGGHHTAKTVNPSDSNDSVASEPDPNPGTTAGDTTNHGANASLTTSNTNSTDSVSSSNRSDTNASIINIDFGRHTSFNEHTEILTVQNHSSNETDYALQHSERTMEVISTMQTDEISESGHSIKTPGQSGQLSQTSGQSSETLAAVGDCGEVLGGGHFESQSRAIVDMLDTYMKSEDTKSDMLSCSPNQYVVKCVFDTHCEW